MIPELPAADRLTPEDRAHLDWSRKIARRGWGRVHPNPMVGCVLVRDGRVVGEGWHKEFGGPHAEIVALEEARTAAEGATAYVSLEPCNHEGKTPPCSHALKQAGVARVVYGVAEPGGAEGGGGAWLEEQGVEVEGPIWPSEVGQAENPEFFHVRRHGTPFVALKLAMTLDGKISDRPGRRSRITGPDAEQEVHRLRTGFDAILVGEGTARVDDPRLTVRLTAQGRRPLRRVVLDPMATLSSDASLFQDAEEAPVHVFVWTGASEAEIERLEDAGAHVHPVAGAVDRLDLDAVLGIAHDIGITSILCEGGATLAASLLAEGRVHRLYLFVAPRTVGDEGVPAFRNGGQLSWDGFAPAHPPEAFGPDTLIVLDRRPA